MNKNIVMVVIGILALAVVVETGYIVKTKLGSDERTESATATRELAASPRVAGTHTAPPQLMKGDKLADSPLAKSAYEVYPTMDTSDAAKTALVSWTVTTAKNADGTASVTLTSKNPADPASTYKVKTGEKLYFVEMSAGDDHADSDTDLNLRDDFGIVVDASGIVQ